MANRKKKIVSWDFVANVYDIFVYLINRRTHKNLKKEIEAMFSPSDLVLECACGTGMLSEVIAAKCKRLIATDYSKNMLRKAKVKCSQYNNVGFAIADIARLDFKDSSFDKVLAANVIHLLDEPQAGLKELVRTCRSGGKIIIPTYISKNPQGKENAFVRMLRKIGLVVGQKFTFSSYKQFFLDAGFKNVEYIKADGRIPCAIAVISKN